MVELGLRQVLPLLALPELGLDIEDFRAYSKAYGMPGPPGTKPARIMPTDAASKISPVVAPALIAGITWMMQRGEQ